MSEHSDDKTRISPGAAGEDRTRIAGAPSADDRTRVAGRKEVDDGVPLKAERTGSTSSSWSHPERWESTSDQPIGSGTIIKQRFVLEELIGHGGMGTVYKARDLRKEEAEDSQPYVALKLLNEEFRRHPDALVSLQREAKKSQVLAHPNIVTVYDFDRDGDQVFMTMEYLQGEPLDVAIRRRGGMGGLPQQEALHIIDRMSRGLAYAHQEGFVHSDFKPGNVFLTQEGNAKILDFGIARAARVGTAGNDDATRFDPTSLGAITPAYASAEMLAGETPEAADDIYALACVAYELLTGRHPFLDEAGNKIPADEAARLGLQPKSVHALPRRLNRAIAQGLLFRREQRFANAGAFLDAIKGRSRLRRALLTAIVLLSLLAAVSWWITIRESDALVSIDDLPSHLDESKALLLQGNAYLETGDVEQAYKTYTQAWESGESLPSTTTRQRAQLKVLVDRRLNAVIDYYLQLSQSPDLDEFSRELLLLTLEALKEQNPGLRDDEIDAATRRLDRTN
ncbi:MAG: protein kinase [Aquisalimonadaceae bacterium]